MANVKYYPRRRARGESPEPENTAGLTTSTITHLNLKQEYTGPSAKRRI